MTFAKYDKDVNTTPNTNLENPVFSIPEKSYLKNVCDNYEVELSFDQYRKLSNSQLTDHLYRLFQKEKQIGDSILLVLKEIKNRRIYASLGYSSLFEMLVRHFHLSETSSYQRLNALKLMESVPAAAKEIFNGDLSLTNAATLQSFIQRTEKEQNKPLSLNEKTELIHEIKNKSTKEAQQILATINPTAVMPRQKEKMITEQITQLQILVDAETLAQLKQVQNLLSHAIPDGDYNQILKYMTQEMIVILQKRKGIYIKPEEFQKHQVDKLKHLELNENKNLDIDTDLELAATNSNQDKFIDVISDVDKNVDINMNLNLNSYANNIINADEYAPKTLSDKIAEKPPTSVKLSVENRSRYISAATKKAIFTKAEYRCQYVSRITGLRCAARHLLEVDHIQPFSQDGSNEIKNLRVLCRTHNQYQTKHTHGFWYSDLKSSMLL